LKKGLFEETVIAFACNGEIKKAAFYNHQASSGSGNCISRETDNR
jgi:hypothetical protein